MSLSLASVIVVINVGGTLTAVILFLFNGPFWEVTVHCIEYAVQASVTATNMFFMVAYRDPTSPLYKYRKLELTTVSIGVVMALIKMLVFGGVI